LTASIHSPKNFIELRDRVCGRCHKPRSSAFATANLSGSEWRIGSSGQPVAPDGGNCYEFDHDKGATVNVAVTTAAEGFPRRAFSVEDVGRMIEAGVIHEDEKFELIEGEIVMMAAKSMAHERIKSALTVAISRALPRDLTIGVEATLRLTDMTMLEPDVAVFPKSLFRKSTKFVQLDSGEAVLVIEVAASSLAYDKGLKARLYVRHYVKEFWVIDANTRSTWVHTGPSGEGWSSITEHGPQDVLTTPALPDFSIRLGEID
jgi:Uma2 family endonuclease